MLTNIDVTETIIIATVTLAIILLGVFLYILLRSRKVKKITIDGKPYIAALGGKSNIMSLQANYSRVSVLLHEAALIDAEALKVLGVVSIIKMTGKVVMLCGDQARDIAYAIEMAIKP